MARGWESKSVEEQVLSNVFEGSGSINDNQRRAAHESAARERHRQALNLQRQNILSQKTSNPARRQALEAALAEIEAQIAAIG
ncbi:MAG: hypothetical protein ACLQHF_02940 [Terracidiphilus sp.]